jgi:MFS family permease
MQMYYCRKEGFLVKNIHYGWFIVLACCATTCCNGIITQASVNFFTPVATELGVGIGTLTVYIMIMALTMAMLYPVVGAYLERYLKPILLMGGVIQYVAMALMGTFHNVYQFWVAGVFLGIGSAVTMAMAAPILINMWFVEKRGLALGISFSCNGIAAAVFSMIAGYGIVSWGWRTTYFVIALCGLLTYVPAILLLVKTPEEKGVLPYGAEHKLALSETADTKSVVQGITFAEALRQPAFYCMLICAAVLAAVAAESSQVSTFSSGHFGLSVEMAATVVAIYSIGGMIGNVVMGIIDDKIGHGKALLLSMAIAVTIQIVFLSIAPLSPLLSPAAFMLGFAYTSYCVVLPGMSGELFGNKDFSRIWACIMSVGSISTAISIPAYGTIFDKTGSYTGVFILIAVFCIICVVSSFMALKFAKK